MIKHIKYFDNEINYQKYLDSSLLVLPNMSFCKDTTHIKLNPYVDYRISVIYNVTDITNPTKLYHDSSNIDLNNINIDGIELALTSGTYQFNSEGEHIVKFQLIDRTVISSNTFNACSDIIVIQLPDNILTIEANAFQSCSSLTSVNFPKKLRVIGSQSFKNCSTISQVELPRTLDTLGTEAFYGCTSLDSLKISSGDLMIIQDSAFEGCTNLSSVNLGLNIKVIQDSAFSGCSNIESILLPNSVNIIEDNAFSSCTNLRSITFGNTLRTIGSNAFQNCRALNEIISLSEIVPEIQSTTFYKIGLNGTLKILNTVDIRNYSTWLSSGDYYLGKYGWTSHAISPLNN